MKKKSFTRCKCTSNIGVINTLDQSIGISVASEQEFIVRHTVRRLTQELKTKKKYQIQVEKMRKKAKQCFHMKYMLMNFYLLHISYYLIACKQ